MSAIDIKNKIRAAQDTRSQIEPVPEWDVTVELRSITAKERGKMMAASVNEDGGTVNFGALYPLMLIAGAFDPESGEQLFTQDDVEWLGEKNGEVVERLAKIIMGESKMDEKAVETEGKDS